MPTRRLPRRNQLGLPVGRPGRYAPRIPVPTAGPLARLGGALAGQTGANHAPDVLVPGNLAGAALTAGRAAARAPISLLGASGAGAGAAGGAGRKPAGTFPSAKPPPTVDPYAPQTPEQIAAQVAAAVKAQTDPVLKQIADSNAARAAAAQQAITGYTTAFGPALQQLAGIGTAGYQTGIQSQAAIDAALQQSLTGGGTAAASELGAKLAQINAPQADQQAAAQAAIGAGSGNAAFATGSAALSALNAQLASAQNVATKQPGIAALYGGQATRDLQAQASRDLAEQQGQITAQIPGLISNLTRDAQDTARSQANANRTFNEGVREFGINRADRVRAANAKVAGDRNRPDPSLSRGSPYLVNAYGEVLTNAKGNPLTNTAYRAPKTAAAKADPLAKPDLNLTKNSGSPVILDGHGKPFLVGGQPLKYAPPATAKTPSASDAKGGLAALASAGGVNWKTGALTPTFRKAAREYITRTTGSDPGVIPAVASTDELAKLQKFLGITPPAPKAKPSAHVDVSASVKVGRWVNTDGTANTALANVPVPKDAAKVDKLSLPNLALTKARGSKIILDGRGRPYQVDGHTLPYTPQRAPSTSATPRQKAVKSRNDAVSEAAHTAYSEGTKLLGKPVRNPQPDSYRNPGIYLDPNGKGTNDANSAAHEGHASWGQAYARVYAAIGGDQLKARYGLREAQVRQIIERQLRALGFTAPKTHAAAKPAGRPSVVTTPATPHTPTPFDVP